MGKINADWHKTNRMPKNPNKDERIQWHIEHAKNCSCREMPPKLIKEIENSGNFLFHGSPKSHIVLKPAQQQNLNHQTQKMENDGEPAVCATENFQIAVFRALTSGIAIDGFKSRIEFEYCQPRFTISKKLLNNIHSSAFIYLFSRKNFQHYRSHEWLSNTPVKPLVAMQINSESLPKDVKII